MNIELEQLLIGQILPIDDRDTPSGINKKPVQGKLFLSNTGLLGDEHGDKKHHGGPNKAIHHYPFEHYATWKNELGENNMLNAPGAFGENFSTLGFNEKNIAIGDVFRIGSALIQVSQGRKPCWKLNIRFQVKDMALRVQRTGQTGWYYRVLEEGYVEPGDIMKRVDRTTPEWSIHRLWKTLYVDTLNYDELNLITGLPDLTDSWRRNAEKRLKTKKVEDWSKRLGNN